MFTHDELKTKTELTFDECNEIMVNNRRSLDLSGCTSLTSLPDNLTVGGDLLLRGCTSLTSLPDNLTVGGGLFLRGCTSLTSLPDNLTVGEYLDLSGCTSLTSLPDNLTVGGGLFLDGCTSLTSLPDNLTVGGGLFLDGCTSLTSLPDNLTVGGVIYSCHRPMYDISSVKRLCNGAYVEGKYLYADFILTHIKSKRAVGKYTVYYGKIRGKNVVYDGTYYAHCDNIRDGIKDIEFKHAENRGCEQYRDLTLDSVMSKDDAITMYRVITGACQQGTQMFIDSLGDNIKDECTIAEIIELTSGQYGSDAFKEFFIDREETE